MSRGLSIAFLPLCTVVVPVTLEQIYGYILKLSRWDRTVHHGFFLRRPLAFLEYRTLADVGFDVRVEAGPINGVWDAVLGFRYSEVSDV